MALDPGQVLTAGCMDADNRQVMLGNDGTLERVISAIGGATCPTGGYKIFSGMDDVPFVAKGPALLNNQEMAVRKQRGGKIHCEIFNLSDPDSCTAYSQKMSLVYSSACAGKAVISSIDRRFVESKCSWMIYLEWIEIFDYNSREDEPVVKRLEV